MKMKKRLLKILAKITKGSANKNKYLKIEFYGLIIL